MHAWLTARGTQRAQTWPLMHPKPAPLHRDHRVTVGRAVFNEIRMILYEKKTASCIILKKKNRYYKTTPHRKTREIVHSLPPKKKSLSPLHARHAARIALNYRRLLCSDGLPPWNTCLSWRLCERRGARANRHDREQSRKIRIYDRYWSIK